MDTEAKVRVFYLCDGKVPGCNKSSCYTNGGECRHTSDITHAENFKPSFGGKFREQDKPDVVAYQKAFETMIGQVRDLNRTLREKEKG